MNTFQHKLISFSRAPIDFLWSFYGFLVMTVFYTWKRALSPPKNTRMIFMKALHLYQRRAPAYIHLGSQDCHIKVFPSHAFLPTLVIAQASSRSLRLWPSIHEPWEKYYIGEAIPGGAGRRVDKWDTKGEETNAGWVIGQLDPPPAWDCCRWCTVCHRGVLPEGQGSQPIDPTSWCLRAFLEFQLLGAHGLAWTSLMKPFRPLQS